MSEGDRILIETIKRLEEDPLNYTGKISEEDTDEKRYSPTPRYD